MKVNRYWTSTFFTVLVFAISGQRLYSQDEKSHDPAQERLISSINGRSLYYAYCATCHGENGKGDGPTATALKTPPADLTQIATRNGGRFPSRDIEKVIAGDLDLTAHGTREMPLWGPIFSQVAWDQDLGRLRIANLVQYIESIQAPPRIPGVEKR